MRALVAQRDALAAEQQRVETEVHAEVKAARAAGAKATEIAAVIGMDRQRVYQILSKG